MRQEKQDKLEIAFKAGKYRVTQAGVVESHRRALGEWRPLSFTLHNGYRQHIMFGPRNSGIRILVYAHIAAYVFFKGKYEPGLIINHKNLDKGDCSPGNLEAMSQKGNVDHYQESAAFVIRRAPGGDFQPIGDAQIEIIRQMLAKGIRNQSAIARAIGRKRLATRYVINKILAGKSLKFENKRSSAKSITAAA